eukprot:11838982-Alexandrium_andersonii.AAC.1
MAARRLGKRGRGASSTGYEVAPPPAPRAGKATGHAGRPTPSSAESAPPSALRAGKAAGQVSVVDGGGGGGGLAEGATPGGSPAVSYTHLTLPTICSV